MVVPQLFVHFERPWWSAALLGLWEPCAASCTWRSHTITIYLLRALTPKPSGPTARPMKQMRLPVEKQNVYDVYIPNLGCDLCMWGAIFYVLQNSTASGKWPVNASHLFCFTKILSSARERSPRSNCTCWYTLHFKNIPWCRENDQCLTQRHFFMGFGLIISESSHFASSAKTPKHISRLLLFDHQHQDHQVITSSFICRHRLQPSFSHLGSPC